MTTKFDRVILIVIDSVGCGELPDAADYGDRGSDTLGHIAQSMNGLHVPTMASLGLGRIVDLKVPEYKHLPLRGAYGRMAERSAGKDTTTGHWEMMGIILQKAFPTFPQGFPSELIAAFEAKIGRKTIGNKAASGTEIIKELGDEHVRTGSPIVYTSADSVFQIACHEDIIPLDGQYEICRQARELLTGDFAVGRVIARPFKGKSGAYARTPGRKDFSVVPFQETVLDRLKSNGLMVCGIGKIEDIFAGKGITDVIHSHGNQEGMRDTLSAVQNLKRRGLIFVNLVDFDMLYGHRNDAKGYAHALEEFDAWLPTLVRNMTPKDLLLITADHGNDPGDVSTDHTREYVPLLAYCLSCRQGVDLGTRSSFSDVGATILQTFNLPPLPAGKGFMTELQKP
ncbi:MAG TPA: phosphopentomutase [Elusimicrobiota bacterium]|nr:phosphopentomutase [Elusimicrobiota bacterium]